MCAWKFSSLVNLSTVTKLETLNKLIIFVFVDVLFCFPHDRLATEGHVGG